MIATPLPFLDLFEQMRSAGIPLTMEQYDLLRQAWDRGYGGEDWDAVRRVCRLVWCRPGLAYERSDFERVLDNYIQERQAEVRAWGELLQTAEPLKVVPQETLGKLPDIPPRKSSAPPPLQKKPQTPGSEGLEQGPSAVKGSSKPDAGQWKMPSRYQVRELPISEEEVQRTWRSLRRSLPDTRLEEIDLEATIERLSREGMFGDVVMQAGRRQQTEWVVLVDESAGMIPYGPIWKPLTTAVETGRLGRVEMYQFAGCPSDYVYDWVRPMRSVAIASVLARLNRMRSVVVIVSAAGAAMQHYDEKWVAEMRGFLIRLAPCVREILWLNPVPKALWRGTSAEEIAKGLSSGMVSFDRMQWQRLSHRLSRGGG
jgi:uncharacterized protein